MHKNCQAMRSQSECEAPCGCRLLQRIKQTPLGEALGGGVRFFLAGSAAADEPHRSISKREVGVLSIGALVHTRQLTWTTQLSFAPWVLLTTAQSAAHMSL